jgi:two-component system sensor histidine kinase SenX3
MDDRKRREFYGVMLADSDRLIHTIDQVLRAGQAKSLRKHRNREVINLGALAAECVTLARIRHHLPETALHYESADVSVRGDADELKAAITNLLDNAIKYSKADVHVTVEVAR